MPKIRNIRFKTIIVCIFFLILTLYALIITRGDNIQKAVCRITSLYFIFRIIHESRCMYNYIDLKLSLKCIYFIMMSTCLFNFICGFHKIIFMLILNHENFGENNLLNYLTIFYANLSIVVFTFFDFF